MTSKFVRTRTLSLWMLAAALCSIVTLLVPARALAVEQGGLGAKPAYPRTDNPRSQSIFVHKLQPGQQISDGVEVINGTSEPKQVLVYAVDSQASSGGAFACAQAVDKPVAVGKWIALDKKEVSLEPAQKQVVNFTITAPKDASPGEHNGCVVIQDTKQQRAPGNNGIVLSMRSAIRVALTVPGEIHKGLELSALGVQPKDDKKVLLNTSLRNSGNVSLDAQLTVTLSYALAGTVARASGSFPVLSGSEARFNFEGQRPFWGGWYRLQAVAAYNNNPADGVGEGSSNTKAAQTSWVFITPQPVAAAVEGAVLVALSGAAWWLLRRSRHHRRILQSRMVHTVAGGEDIRTIAEQYGMSWKTLARVNKLKPPYQLKAGQRLRVGEAMNRSVSERHTPRK